MKNKQTFFNAHFINEHRDLFIGIIFVLFVAILSTLGQSNWFKSSLLETSNPFNGTVYPVQQSPDYITWKGNIKTDTFSSIAANNLVPLPNYTDALKEMSAADLLKNPEIHNAKLTFPVVYLGSYEGDFKEENGSHLAVDIRIPVGTPVQSIANGTAIKVDMGSGGFGHHTCIRHINVPDPSKSGQKTTLISCYNHMDEIFIKEGEFIFKGSQIGTSGNTGTSTTPHLHFQIDRDSAPWHPWWPFSGAEAAQANLSFFSAVSAGLNKIQAKENTVNPLNFIASNYSATPGATLTASTNNTAPQTETTHAAATAEPILTKFELLSDTDEFYTSENTSILITARDQNGEILKTFKASSELTVSSNSNSADFSKVLRFLNGKAKLVVKNEVVEDFEITISENNIKGSILLITKDPIIASNDNVAVIPEETETSTETVAAETPATVVTTTETPKQTVASVKFSGDTQFFAGNTLLIYVELKDQDQALITKLDESLAINVQGQGTITPNKLTTEDVKSGKAILRYSSDIAEIATITIAGQEFTMESIETVHAAAEAAGFSVSSEDNKFIKNNSTTVVIQAVDKDGNDVSNYTGLGTVTLTITEGEGTLEPSELTRDNFKNGKAEIMLTTTSETIKIKAQSGVYIGESKTLGAEKDTAAVFTDVPATHKNAEAIRYLKNNDIIGGYQDGSFQPTKEVSRIEALKMLLLGLNKGLKPADTFNFPDAATDAWYSDYIARALNLTMVKGYPDGSFKPGNSVNRAEYFKILITATGAKLPTVTKAPFNDVPADAWFSPHVAYAKEMKIIDTATNFYPSGNVTRAEVAETLYRILMLDK